MANVHRAYDVFDDCYIVRVEGTGNDAKNLHRFSGPNSERDSYVKLRSLILLEQRKDPKSRMIDHAQAT